MENWEQIMKSECSNFITDEKPEMKNRVQTLTCVLYIKTSYYWALVMENQVQILNSECLEIIA